MPVIPYLSGDRSSVLGHYAQAQRSGEIAATLSALGHLARLRWAPSLSNTYCVIERIKIGWSVSGDITSGKIEMPFRAIIARGFTVDFTTAITKLDLSGGSGRLRSVGSSTAPGMSASQMGTSGPGICTTVVMSGQTLTADAAPVAIATTAPLNVAVSATGTATLATQGMCSPPITLYERTAEGQHPIVLSNNEGVIIQNVLAGPASGTFGLYVQWEWAEVFAFS